MPKPQRSAEIQSQQQPADENAGERDVVAEPSEWTVFRFAEQVDQDREKITSTRETTEKEVE